MSTKKDAKKPWLDEGLKILETRGPVMLSIENLTSATGKTKGSFYHHFTSRDDYIKNLLDYYEETTTKDVIQVTGLPEDPEDSLKRLTKMTFQFSSGLELAMRAWALYDKKVRRFQDRMDRSRIEHIKELHIASGMDKETAGIRSYRDYSLFIGLQQIRHHYSEDEFRKLLKDIFAEKS